MSDALLQFPWNIAWQSAALLTLGLVASAAWRARPARAHAALGLAAAACLIVPLLGAAVGRLGLGLIARPVAYEPSVRPITAPSRPGPGDRLPAPIVVPPSEQRAADSAAIVTSPPVERHGPGPWAASAWAHLTAWRLAQLAITLWGLMTATLLGALGVAWVAGKRATATGDAIDDIRLVAPLRMASDRLGVRMPIDLRASGRVHTPAIWCWSRRPAILLPRDWDRAGADWAAVFAHELAHLRRGDHWWALAAELASRLVPWNPLGWIARARLAALAERACDDWAVHAAADPCAYAETLLSLAPSRGPRLALSAVSSRRGLAGRIRRILAAPRAPGLGRAWAVAAAALAASATVSTALIRERTVPRPIEQPPAPPRDAAGGPYAERMAGLAADNWRAAFALGQEIAALPPDEGWSILRDNWTRIQPIQARQQILKAWAFRAPDGRTPSGLVARSHPHVLDALDLGMRDASAEVRSWAVGYLRPIAFRDFDRDPDAYAPWRRATSGRPVDEVALVACRAWVERVKTGDGEAMKFMREAQRVILSNPQARAAAVEVGLPGALEKAFTGVAAASSRDVAGDAASEAVGLFADLALGEAELRRAILPLIGPGGTPGVRSAAIRALGDPDNRWAVEPLRQAMVEALAAPDEESRSRLWSLAGALADIGDPSVIPTMIGIIDADNTYTTVYGVGYFGLSKLTGVPYDGRFDGPWWRAWWDRNKQNYPPEVRALAIPSLPRTPTYVPRVYDHAEWIGTVGQEPIERIVTQLHASIMAGDREGSRNTARALADRDDPRLIPLLIGVIDSDNSRETIYEIGGQVLGKLTGVPYDERYDGPWWRAWWAKNRDRFPPQVRNLQISDLAKSPNYVASVYDHGEWIGTAGEEPIERIVADLHRRVLAGGGEAAMYGPARRLSERKDPRAIPMLIGVIDTDNTHDTIYGVGYFGLSNLTGVRYDARHDGPWWRAWWEKNNAGFPAEAQSVPIPTLEKGPRYVSAAYNHGEWIGTDDEPVERMVTELARRQEANDVLWTSSLGRAIGDRGDPRAIPLLIEIVRPMDEQGVAQGVHDALGKLTRVGYEESHDGAWWRAWWQKNKARFEDPPRAEQPWWEGRDAVRPAERAKQERDPAQPAPTPWWDRGDAAQPAAAPDQPNASPKPIKGDDEIEVADLRAGGDAYKRYLLIGPKANAAEPADGWKLLLVLPGGDGSAEFHPFVRNMAKRAVPDGYLVAQLVAPKWRDDENRVVWPTAGLPDDRMKFTTEAFIAAVVDDATSRKKVDRKHVCALGWSSGGPPVYSSSVTEGTPLTGAFVAMSVFHPNTMPPLAAAKGKSYYLLHSPTDFIKMKFPEDAKAKLTEAGATVHLETYEGGHGWHGDVFGHIRRSVDWLEQQSR